jgi:hypothetical protein
MDTPTRTTALSAGLAARHSLSIDFRAECFDIDQHRSNGVLILLDAIRHSKRADRPNYVGR